MPRRAKGPRVIGVYSRGRRWRVRYVCEDGQREEVSFETKARADRYAARLERQLSAPGTFDDAIVAYREYLKERGNKPRSIRKTIDRITYVMGNVELWSLDVRELRELYAARAKRVAADTHRRELAECKTFLRWCGTRGWLSRLTADELDQVVPTGRRRRGPESKRQLRINEARQWLDEALELARGGRDGALGATLTLLCGLRSGEVRGLKARDVDDGGRLLWVDGTKSDSARRTVEVPEAIRPLLVRQAQQRDGGALWSLTGLNWVNNWVRRICRKAKVPIVCAHSMRGLHATLAREAGATGHLVAAELGHASEAMHVAAYAERDAVQRGSQRRALRVLQGGR